MDGRTVNYEDWDHAVVQRIIEGRRLSAPYSAADAARVVRVLAGRGWSDGQIAYRLGCYRRSVARIRARLNIPSGWPRTRAPQDQVNEPSRARQLG